MKYHKTSIGTEVTLHIHSAEYSADSYSADDGPFSVVHIIAQRTYLHMFFTDPDEIDALIDALVDARDGLKQHTEALEEAK